MSVEPEPEPAAVPEAAAPVAAPAPPVAETPVPAAAPAAEPVAAPWSGKLETAFPEEQRGAVDAFIRAEFQPYVTELEAERAELRTQASWYQALRENPEDALGEAVRQLYGDAEATRVLAALTAAEAATEPESPAAAAVPPGEDPDIQWLRDFRERQEQVSAEQAYIGEFTALKEANPDVVDEVFHALVASAPGDMPLTDVLALYRKAVPAPAAEVPEAPAVGGPGSPAPRGALSLQAVVDRLHASL